MAGQTITVSVLADTKKFSSAMGKLGDETGLNKLGAGLKTMGKAAAVGLAAVGAATVAWAGSTAKALADIERIGAATDAVLKSTGGAAGRTRKDIDDLAASIEKMSGVEAEVVTEGQNMLLTFTGIKGANFDRATSTMTDMAVAMNKGSLEGLDMKSTSIQLGKALNDPIKGITALSKVGVSFTDQQKAQIKAMQEAGDVAGAQTIILDELAKEFGGAAEAAGGTALGKWAKIKNMFGEISERVLAFLLPALTAIGDWVLTKGLPLFDTFGTWLETKFIPAIKDAGKWVGDNLVPKFKDLWAVIQTNVLPVVKDLGSWFVNTLIPALVSFGGWVVKNKDWLGALAVVVGTMVVGIQGYIKVMAIWKAATVAAAAVQALFNAVMTANPIGLIVLAIAALVAGLVYFFTQTETGQKIVAEVWPKIVKVFNDGIEKIKEFLGAAWDYIKTVWSYSPLGLIVNNWGAIMNFFSAIPGKVQDFFMQAWGVIQRIWSYSPIGAITGNWQAILNFFGSIGGWISGAFSGAGSWLYNAGRNVIQGLLDGVNAVLHKVRDVASSIANAVTAPVKKLLGIKSPSRVFRQLGQYTIEGLQDGLRDVAGLKGSMRLVSGVVTGGFDPNLTLNAPSANANKPSVVYNVTVNALEPNAEVGRVVYKSLVEFERLNGNR